MIPLDAVVHERKPVPTDSMRFFPLKMNTSLESFDENDYFPSYVDVSDQWQATVETAAVLILCFITIIFNLVTGISLIVISREVLDFYLLSLCFADLLASVAVVPLSIAAKSNFQIGGDHPACAVSGYLHVSLCAVRMYTFMWAAVDRYLAVRKPLRYDGIQTRARCQCWVLFSWVTATCLCCPPWLGDAKRHFYYEGFLCLMDVSSMFPYSITLGCLVLIPSVLTMIYTYTYIFTTSDYPREESDPKSSNHVVVLIIILQFLILWLPWCSITVLEHVSERSLVGSTIRFWLLFLGESYITCTPLTLLILHQRCRDGFTTLCVKSATEVPV